MTNPTVLNNAKRESFLTQLEGLQLLGEVISWEAFGPHPYAKVKQALLDADLDETVARERLPQHAFARAARTLSENRTTDIVRNAGDEIVFQFTKKALIGDSDEGGKQWEFLKEAKLLLNKTTGKITCKRRPELEERAQTELDKHLEQRTAGDITAVIQRLFLGNADLIPLRKQGGVYVVPIEQQPFLFKIEDFLSRLGGRLNRLPIPAGTSYGDKTFQDCMADYLKDLIQGHREAVQQFTAQTRPKTLALAVDKLRETKLKLQAYSHYLKDRSVELEEAVAEAHKEVVMKFVEIEKTNKNGTEENDE